MKKIVFLESGENNPNNIKRMEEFKARGYDVVAYAFSRNQENKNFPKVLKCRTSGHSRQSLHTSAGLVSSEKASKTLSASIKMMTASFIC